MTGRGAMRRILPGLAVFFCQGVVGAADNPLQSLINAARPGDTVRVPAGIYSGGIVIGKPLQLVGENGAEIRGSGLGKVVTIAAPDVTLRGFLITDSGRKLMDDDAAVFVTADRATIADNRIRNSLHGIYLKKANDCRLIGNDITGTAPGPEAAGRIGDDTENCEAARPSAMTPGNGIHQWNCERNELSGNSIRRTRDGMYFSFTNHCKVTANTVHHVRYGLHYMYSDDNVFVENLFSDNAAGAAVMFSERLEVRENDFVSNRGARAYGLILQSVDDSRIESNRIERNAVGISFNQCNRNRVTANRIARNYIGLRFGGNSDENMFSANAFPRNLHPAEMAGETGSNRWEIAGVGNCWDRSVPLDLDADGIGDIPHRELDVFGILRRDFPPIALLSESPALRLLRFAHQRAALPGLNTIQDNAPLTPRFPRGISPAPRP